MNEDMGQYLGLFLDEADEQIRLLEQDILLLEQSPSPALLQEIFRAAHTLKGSSRAMGFAGMGELTHAMEDVFDHLRQQSLPVSEPLIDALLSGLDALKSMRQDIAQDGATTLEAQQETARLRALAQDSGFRIQDLGHSSINRASACGQQLSTINFPPLSPEAREAAQGARASGCGVYQVTLEIASDCVMKSVRALMTLQALERVGSLLACMPDENALEAEAFDWTFAALIATDAGMDEIARAAEGVSEIRCASVAAWTPEAAEAEAAGEAAEQEETAGEAERELATGQSDAPLLVAAEARAQSMPAPAAPGARTAPLATPTVRVDVARLDNLLNLVGELVIDRTRLTRIGQSLPAQSGGGLLESLNETVARIGRVTDELQDEIMKARMLPLETVFNRFPRMIRDLAQRLGKEIQFEVEGQETELDRSVIEVIGDPLIHMLRNSVDHGIETPVEREQAGKPRAGTVRLCARHQENLILIEIQDDGRGIDPARMRDAAVRKNLLSAEAAAALNDREAIQLIFAPGFSTAATLTEISGRGVGMDIVKSNLQRLGAQIDIDSRVGAGTTFRVALPLTLAITRGLLARAGGCEYALPLHSVVETIKMDPASAHRIGNRDVFRHRGRALPLIRLEDALPIHARGLEEARPAPAAPPAFVVIAGVGDRQMGVGVDALVGEQEVVIKGLGAFIGEIKGITGATILGDGRVALIVDMHGLTELAAEGKEKAYAA